MEIKVETRFGDLELLVAIAPFDQALAALQREKATLATAQQVAQARIVAGLDSEVGRYGSWVAENFVYFPNGEVVVTSAEVYTLKQTEDYEIPIKKFAKNGLARFVFGDTTADYAKFLQKAGINEV